MLIIVLVCLLVCWQNCIFCVSDALATVIEVMHCIFNLYISGVLCTLL